MLQAKYDNFTHYWGSNIYRNIHPLIVIMHTLRPNFHRSKSRSVSARASSSHGKIFIHVLRWPRQGEYQKKLNVATVLQNQGENWQLFTNLSIIIYASHMSKLTNLIISRLTRLSIAELRKARVLILFIFTTFLVILIWSPIIIPGDTYCYSRHGGRPDSLSMVTLPLR